MKRVTAEPFDYPFDLAHTALVLIDMQRDFVEPGGFGESLGNDVSRLQAIVPTLARVLAAWRDAGGLVVHTRESHLPDLSDCPPAKRLRGSPTLRIGDVGPMGRVLVAGVTTEVCVQTTMREANDRGYDCLLVEDATESYFPAFKQATLEMVRAQGGIVGWTAPCDAVLAALRDDRAWGP